MGITINRYAPLGSVVFAGLCDTSYRHLALSDCILLLPIHEEGGVCWSRVPKVIQLLQKHCRNVPSPLLSSPPSLPLRCASLPLPSFTLPSLIRQLTPEQPLIRIEGECVQSHLVCGCALLISVRGHAREAAHREIYKEAMVYPITYHVSDSRRGRARCDWPLNFLGIDRCRILEVSRA